MVRDETRDEERDTAGEAQDEGPIGAVEEAAEETPADVAERDEADLDDQDDDDNDYEAEDYTYFCTQCGHEQFDGELCEECGGEDWEFVRLDEEGLRRQAEARGEEWTPGASQRTAATGLVSVLTPELETTLDAFLEDLVREIYGDGGDSAGHEEEEEISPKWKRIVAEETFREWVETNREWLLREIIQTESEPGETTAEAGEAAG